MPKGGDAHKIVPTWQSGGRFEVTFLCPHAGIAAKSNPVQSLAARIQAKNFVVRLADVFDRTKFVMTNSSHAIVYFEHHDLADILVVAR